MEMNNSSQEYENDSTYYQYTDPNTSQKTSIPISRPGSSNRELGNKREHSPEKEWSKGKSPPQRNEENTKEDGGKDRLKKFQPARQCHQQPMPMHSKTTSTCPTDGNATSDYYNVDPNQSNYMMHQYNMYNTMNQWDVSVSSNMLSMDMASTSTDRNHSPYVAPTDTSINRMIVPMPGYCPMMNSVLPTMPQKVTMTFPSCTLLPPHPCAPAPFRRNRPNGCKTVFVGGLPEKITEKIIREAFSGCGEISTVRMTKKNFCHIRFTSEHHVDQAMFFSGYSIKIENEDEPTYNGRLHVDFAIARDDQYEYESRMRTLSREARHVNDDVGPPSPPPIVNYSECEAATVGANLRNKETFTHACNILITWLDKGQCNKRNAGTFYSMIQSTYSHVRRLVAEKTKIEDEITAVKQKLHQQSTSNAAQFTDIERVFQFALMQKVWDHFTKAQRKYIDQWKRQTTDTKMQNLEGLLEERIEDEMEMSDGEDRDASEDSEMKEELSRLREDQVRLQEENEMLRSQLRTANDETVSVKDESKKKITSLGDTYQLMQRNYLETKKKLEETVKEKLALGNRESISLDRTQMRGGNCQSAAGVLSVTESEARLVSLIANFLNVHPLGASIDYICSYLLKMDRNINTRDVENLMKKFNTVFKEESTGIGATLEKKWTFWGYKFYTSPTSESIF